MSIFDLQKDVLPSEISCDVCIVGTGPAGISIAKDLLNKKLKVILMESGDLEPNHLTQELYDIINLGYPIRKDFMSRARYYGGTTNIWSGRTMLLSPIDLKKRSWIPDSGWPIKYDELMSYYEKATRILELPSLEKFSRSFWSSLFNPCEKAIFQDNNLDLNVSVWGKKPVKVGKKYFSKFRESSNVDVFLNSNLVNITLTENKKLVFNMRFSSLNANSVEIRPKVCVLACGGIENPRLLLNFRDQLSCGLGNQNDMVGRYYSDHPRIIMGTVKLFKKRNLPLLVGVPIPDGKVQFGIQFSEDIQRSNKLLNNYLSLEPEVPETLARNYDTLIRMGKRLFRIGYSGRRLDFSEQIARIPDLIYYLTPKELIPHRLYSLFSRIKRFSRGSNGPYTFRIANYSEQSPNWDSKVFLSNMKDCLSLNKIQLDWRLNRDDENSVLMLQDYLADTLKKNDIGRLYRNITDLTFTDASHHIGTTRMSDNTKKGVVDSKCRVHGIKNLYIAGSSVFPTSGHANPTLTIVALSLRLSDQIQKDSPLF